MLSEEKVYEVYFRGLSPEEISFNYDLQTIKKASKVFNIKGRSAMNKIVLCLNIEQHLNEKGVNY